MYVLPTDTNFKHLKIKTLKNLSNIIYFLEILFLFLQIFF